MKKTKLIIFLLLSLLIVLGFYFNTLIRNSRLKKLSTILDPEIYSIVTKDGLLNMDSVNKIITNQKSFTYHFAFPGCDPEIYECDSSWPTPTKEQKSSKYYKFGYMDSEYFYKSEDDYKNILESFINNYQLKFYKYLPSCDNYQDISIYFASKDKDKVIDISINIEENIIEIVTIGSLNSVSKKCVR